MDKNDIYVIYGDDIAHMTRQLAEHADLAALIGDTNKRVGLKPNLVLDSPASEGATTHPEIAASLIEYLYDHGFGQVVVMEGSWVGCRTSSAFDACGYTQLAQHYGIELIDTQTDETTTVDCKGMPIELCKSALEVDFMINLPVQKGHCQTGITCALKNNKGVISNNEKRRFHSMGLHKPIAHLNTAAKSDFIVVDAICGDLDFEEGGNPVPGGCLFAARDPVLCDAYAATHMGFAIEEIPYIGMAATLGVGSHDLSAASIIQLNTGQFGGAAPAPTGKARHLARYTRQQSACSACYAALVRALARLSPQQLNALPGPVCVGQGFAQETGELGVGRCTSAFLHSVAGCPPTAGAIIKMLETFDCVTAAAE